MQKVVGPLNIFLGGVFERKRGVALTTVAGGGGGGGGGGSRSGEVIINVGGCTLNMLYRTRRAKTAAPTEMSFIRYRSQTRWQKRFLPLSGHTRDFVDTAIAEFMGDSLA